MSFAIAAFLKPLAVLGAVAALALVRKGIQRFIPDSKLKRILLFRV